MAAGVAGVPWIGADGSHEGVDHPPDPVAGEGAPLACEDRIPVRDILTLCRLPRQEGFRWAFSFWGMNDTQDSLCCPGGETVQPRGVPRFKILTMNLPSESHPLNGDGKRRCHQGATAVLGTSCYCT